MPWDFQLPTKVHFGRGTLRKVGTWTASLGARALLIGYRDRSGLEEAYQRAEQSLAKAGLATALFLEVLPEPEAELVDHCAAAARTAHADVLVALGGGSVIDLAKAAAALTPAGGLLADYLSIDPAPAPAEALPVIAVPTTAGTGSEVSDVAVFAHDSGKAALFGPALRPRLAVVDPDLAVGSPASLTAACGADALGHAIEACVSRRTNPLATLLAAEAVTLIVQNLPPAVVDPKAVAPRESLALAATLAGAAFSSAGVAGAHAVAQALGVVLGLPHGRAVALALPPVLRFNAAACVEQYTRLARGCGLPDAEAFLGRVRELLASVGLSEKLALPPAVVDQLVSAAQAARVPLVQNPVRLDEPALRQVFAELAGQ
jgi:alcohol dehydrogenase class IV